MFSPSNKKIEDIMKTDISSANVDDRAQEIAIGLVNGSALGTLFGILAYMFQRNIVLTFVAETALGVNVILAGIIGGSMPFLIKNSVNIQP